MPALSWALILEATAASAAWTTAAAWPPAICERVSFSRSRARTWVSVCPESLAVRPTRPRMIGWAETPVPVLALAITAVGAGSAGGCAAMAKPAPRPATAAARAIEIPVATACRPTKPRRRWRVEVGVASMGWFLRGGLPLRRDRRRRGAALLRLSRGAGRGA